MQKAWDSTTLQGLRSIRRLPSGRVPTYRCCTDAHSTPTRTPSTPTPTASSTANATLPAPSTSFSETQRRSSRAATSVPGSPCPTSSTPSQLRERRIRIRTPAFPSKNRLSPLSTTLQRRRTLEGPGKNTPPQL